MPDTAVSDTGPVLHLHEIGEVPQLRVFQAVVISEQVKAEISRRGVWDRISTALAGRLRVEKVSAQEITEQGRSLSAFTVHRADLSVAALAARIQPEVVLTDDLRLRKGLESQGYQVVGSIGVLIRAFRERRLTKPELLTRVDQLLNGSTLYTSEAFRATIRAALDEAE